MCRQLSWLLDSGTSLRQGKFNPSATKRIPEMNILLSLSAAVTKISRFGMAGVLMAFASIALLGVSHPAYASSFIYEGTYNTGVLDSAYENTGTQINTVAIPLPTAEFTHPNDYIIINAITPVGFSFISGETDDQATSLRYLSGTATLNVTKLYSGSSDTVTTSWNPIDTILDGDIDSGLWLGTFEVDFTFYGYPSGYPGPFGAYPEMYEYVTFDAQVNDTPEPGSLLLFGSGLLGLAGMLRRKLGRV
jgi:hypothetical protein